ncbi:ribonuclease E [Pseudohongiella sp. O18]|uniref:ribonuclease E n=1 Tax=Pseudohongiella sp. O18 TaxID=2904248 RepID=UPI001EFFBC10|nr:ribonuclease E [Pseudohongiella sp. O18]
MKRMLINATQEEELRVALVDGQKLYDLDIENRTRIQKKASIFKGRITRVEPSLEAAFVDFGAERHGFLPLKEIAPEYFTGKSDGGRVNIKEAVAEGTEVIIQVEKEERGNKGAALTTFISLAGRYLVLMPNNPRAGGISRRIEGDERSEIREAINSLNIPDGMGIIVRTAGVGKNQEDLQWDLDYLLSLWQSIKDASDQKKAPFLIYQESNVIIRCIRDYLRQDIGEVLFDTQEAYEEALNFVRQVMPHYEARIKHYQDPLPLFNRYQIENQIESAFQREVKLPSGGSIVIDPTEALISIDINSSRATRGSDIEETALNTNLEAADEIARQLRLRDMGGLVVIDFIDMASTKNQKEVENRVRDALEADRARVQVGRISRFGLLEMSRQRLRPSLEETNAVVCPRCSGQGTIRDVKSLCLSILRILQEEANKKKSAEIRAIVPLNVASYLLNEKRNAVAAIEQQSKTRLLIIPSPSLETPHYEIQSLSAQDGGVALASFEIETEHDHVEEIGQTQKPLPVQQAAVQAPTVPAAPAPRATESRDKPAGKSAPAKKGFLGSLLSVFGELFGAANDEEEEENKTEQRGSGNNRNRSRSGGSDRNRNRGNRGRGGDSRSRDDSRAPRDDQKREEQKSDERGGKAQADKSQDKSNDKDGDNKPQRSSRRRGGRGRNRSDDDSQGGNRQDRGSADKSSSDSSDEQSGDQQDNSNRRPKGERKPRNTTKRKRGPHPDGQTESTDDQQVAADAQATDTAGNEAETAASATSDKQDKQDKQAVAAAEQPADAGASESTKATQDSDEQAQNADEQSEKPKRRRSRGGRSRRGKSSADKAGADKSTGDDNSTDSADSENAADVTESATVAEKAAIEKPAKKTEPKAEEKAVGPAETSESKKTDSGEKKPQAAKPEEAASADAEPKAAADDKPAKAAVAAEKAEKAGKEQKVEKAEEAKPAKSEPEKAETVQAEPAQAAAPEQQPESKPESSAQAAPASGGRAPNDPREIRRRRLEEEKARKQAESDSQTDSEDSNKQ